MLFKSFFDVNNMFFRFIFCNINIFYYFCGEKQVYLLQKLNGL